MLRQIKLSIKTFQVKISGYGLDRSLFLETCDSARIVGNKIQVEIKLMCCLTSCQQEFGFPATNICVDVYIDRIYIFGN